MTAARVYVGNLDPNLAERDLRDQFEKYGPLRSVWIARKPPGFAFVEFEDDRDASDAVKRLDGRGGWKVEFSRRGERSARGGPPGGGGFGGGYGGGMMGRGRELRCYECNEVGHLARDCRLRMGGGGGRRSPPPRGRSRSPVRRSSPRRSPRYSRSRSRSPRRSPSYDKRRSPARRDASRSRSRSPARRRTPSKSRSRSPAVSPKD